MRSPNGQRKQAEEEARTADAFHALPLPKNVRWTDDVQNRVVVVKDTLEFERRTGKFIYIGGLLHSAWSDVADKMTRMHNGSYAKYTFSKSPIPILVIRNEDTDHFVLVADTSRTVEASEGSVFPGLWLSVSAGNGVFPAFATVSKHVQMTGRARRTGGKPQERYRLTTYNHEKTTGLLLKTADGCKGTGTLHVDLFASLLYAAAANMTSKSSAKASRT